MENLDKSKLEADVNGQSAQIQIKTPAAQVGARLSKRFKGGFLVLAGALVTVMMIGIMTAGNQEQSGQSADEGKGDQVGLSTPDIGSLQKKAADLNFSPQPSGDAKVGQGGNQGAQTPQVAPTGQLSPAEAHQQWKQEQYYKAEQARLANAQSATGSTLTVNGLSGSRASNYSTGGSLSNGTASSAQGFDPNQLRQQAAQAAALSQNGGAGPNGVYSQTGNKDFVSDQRKTDSVYLNAAVSNPIGKYELFASSVIPAVTLSGINSDLPGSVSAQVRQTVYDSRDGRTVLIPQGAKVVGEYSSSVSYGQKRVLIAWQHLIFPNGQSLPIGGMLGADGQGQSGLYDQVDNHYGRIFGSALLISMLGVATQLSQPQNTSMLSTPSTGSTAAGAAMSQLNTAGTNLLNKNLNVAPTLIIQPGFAFNIMVNKTMVLPAYK